MIYEELFLEKDKLKILEIFYAILIDFLARTHFLNCKEDLWRKRRVYLTQFAPQLFK